MQVETAHKAPAPARYGGTAPIATARQKEMDRMSSEPRTLAEKIWDAHVVRSSNGEPDLLYIDLHIIHEVTSPQAFDGLRAAGRKVRRPDLTIATEDHNVPPLGVTGPSSRRCARTRPSSASGCTRWATPARASCT